MRGKEQKPFNAVESAADIVDHYIEEGTETARKKGDFIALGLWNQLRQGQVTGDEWDYHPENYPDFRVSHDDGDFPSFPFGDDNVPGM